MTREQRSRGMDRSVLAHQFVAGLQTELKLQVARSDGTCEELHVFAKARLRKAKL